MPAGPTELPYTDGAGRPLTLGDGGPVATNPGGRVSMVMIGGITGFDGAGGSLDDSSNGGSGLRSSALRKEPCVSPASMLDSGRDYKMTCSVS